MKLLALALAAGSLATGGTINGTLGWVPLGISDFQGPALGSATAVTVSATESVNALPATFNGAPNDFLATVALGNLVLIPPAFLTLTVDNINGASYPYVLPGYSSWGQNGFFRFSFSVSRVEWSSSASTNLSLIADGILIDRRHIFEPTPGLVSASFTTTGEGDVDTSFTFSSEQVPVSDVSPGLSTLAGVLLICWLRAGRLRALPR